MPQYDNNKHTLWYKADGRSKTAILDLLNQATPVAQRIAGLKLLGVLDHAAVQIHKGEIGHPRAYETAATLWADPSQADTFYIECPVDYQGNHYAPPDAAALNDTQTARVTASLFHGGWGDSMPLSANFTPRRGTAMPADFDDAKSLTMASGTFKPEHFDDTRLFRVEGDLLWTIRKYAADNNIDLGKSPQAIYGDAPALTDSAFEGVTLNHDAEQTGHGVPVPLAPGGIKAARPSLWLFPEAMYIEYKNLAPGAGPKHKDLTEVDLAEYIWMRLNRDDREIGIRPPEPPAALDHLYVKNVFLASGASRAVLDFDYKAQHKMYKDLRAFEDKNFGKPDPRTVFNVGGAEIRSYGQKPQPEWMKDGAFKGFRFDWQPLNGPGRARYAIPAQPVPAGWMPVQDHPGVYLPDPAHLPAQAQECTAFHYPPLQRRAAICGRNPVITIRNPASRFPRADKQWPSIHTDYQIKGAPYYYIDVPADYKGNVHRPDGAERLPKLQWDDFRASLGDMYEPDWIMPEPVTVPADFVREKPKRVHGSYFVLRGASLSAYRLYQQQCKDADQSRSNFIKSLGDTGSYGYRGNTLSEVEFKTPPGAGWMPTNGMGRNNYAPDPSTPEGLKILSDFAALPDRPDLRAAFQARSKGHNGVPHFHEFENHKGLVIAEFPAGSKPFQPTDAIRMQADMFGWLREEKNDVMCRQTTPPMPQEIAVFLAKCLKTPPPALYPPNLPKPA